MALDQTRLPWEEHELRLQDAAAVAEAIRRLAIRGAPLIGVAGAYGVALELARDPSAGALERARAILRDARPTAVNLAHAVDRVCAAAARAGEACAEGEAGVAGAALAGARAALAEARALEAEEAAASAAIARHGADLLAGCRRVLTHCNTGALAAPGRGTALAVVAELHDRGELELAIATESRPLLQGARLTAYELGRLGIRHELIVDSAAAGLILAGGVHAVVVGCDRVAANGDVANKVGTLGLALAARAARIPFVVAGPTSTVDPHCASGEQIEIEERPGEEVTSVAGRGIAPAGTVVRNPAFDVTPAELVGALVTERGVAEPVGPASVQALLAG